MNRQVYVCVKCGRKYNYLFDLCECGCKPDYEGFVEHISELDQIGIPWDRSDLVKLAKIYGTPIVVER